jgi:hypothetical protein
MAADYRDVSQKLQRVKEEFKALQEKVWFIAELQNNPVTHFGDHFP